MNFVFHKIESYANKYDLEYMKEKIFSIISLIMSLLTGPVMLYGAYLFYQDGLKV